MTDSGNEQAKLEDFISRSDELAEWLNQHAYEFTCPDEPKSRLAISCFYVALEHHKSIVLLVLRKYAASAFALVRIMVEAFVAGEWLLFCSSPADLEYFAKKGNFNKNFGEMVKDIENNNENNTGMLSTVKRKAFSGMSGYVHTGIQQLSRHMTDKTIEPNFEAREIIQMLNFVNNFGLFAGLRMNVFSSSTYYLDKFDDKWKEYNGYSEEMFNSWNSNS